MDMNYDKINDGICFRESDHVYFEKDNPENRYISVTTLIDSFTQDFDKDFWSAYKALEILIPKENWAVEKKSLLSKHRIEDSLLELYNITRDDLNREQQKILDSWDEENRKSCERGTAIHSELEHGFYSKGKNCDVSKFGLGGKFECRQNYSELDLPRGVYPEYLIHKKTKDGILRLAGQVDLIIKDGNDIIIVDHKGLDINTIIPTSTGYKKMSEIKVGDKLFDKDGNVCTVTAKSETHYNPCYKITFDNNDTVIADHEHRWLIMVDDKEMVITTEEMFKYFNNGTSLRILSGVTAYENLREFHPVYIIQDIQETETVPTQCIAVDSPSHTYCFGYSMIPTHNTNKEIKMKAGFNNSTKSEQKMKYPLNNLPDSNFWHYSLQLSTYAWMLQQINPNFVIKDLILNHYDHKGNNTLYHCDYLKDEVERMLVWYKKELIKKQQQTRRKPIEY